MKLAEYYVPVGHLAWLYIWNNYNDESIGGRNNLFVDFQMQIIYNNIILSVE